MNQNRELYRSNYNSELIIHRLTLGETDLAICLPPGIWNSDLRVALSAYLLELRRSLQGYIAQDPVFASTHAAYLPAKNAPALAFAMANAAALVGVGPMATVAGAFAQAAGEFLAAYSSEVIVENGGDIYLATTKERIVGVYAGDNSPFSGQLGIKIPASAQPLGICTSSGTVGPSFSYGKADAAVLLATDALLADAAASAVGNRVQSVADVQQAAEYASTIPGVTGALVICNDALAAWGAVELVRPGGEA